MVILKMQKTNKNNELIIQINELRTKMVAQGMKNGLNDPNTIKFSKRLDELIFQYQKQYFDKNK